MITYKALEKRLGFKTQLPVTKDWSAAADFLNLVSDYCLSNKPQVIVECSSGTSSLVLSRCCQLNARGHVYSLENGEPYAKNTRQQLKELSLAGCCDVIHAPLTDYQLNNVSFKWYSMGQLPKVEIDMLVIDGPPGFIQKKSRYPALPLLYSQFAKNSIIFLDDAGRDDEKDIVQRWIKDYPEFETEYIDNERGCSILRRS